MLLSFFQIDYNIKIRKKLQNLLQAFVIIIKKINLRLCGYDDESNYSLEDSNVDPIKPVHHLELFFNNKKE